MAVALVVAGCASEPQVGEVAPVEGFAGVVVGDEPNAVVVGREVLAQNGTAADAAVAMGFTLGVTYPSRAGLAGGGACLAFDKEAKTATEISFMPDSAAPGAGVAPMTARGLALLHARFGTMRWETLLTPAENLARFGHRVSRALAADLARGADVPAAYKHEDGHPYAEGEKLVQLELAAALSGVRLRGGGYLNSGTVAERFAEGATAAGHVLSAEEVRAARPRAAAAASLAVGNDRLYVTSDPFDGGRALASEWQALTKGARTQGADRTAADKPSAGFVVGDRYGNAVACGFTLNGLFGTGELAGETGLLMAAPPASGAHAPAVAMIGNENTARFKVAVAGTGKSEAAGSVARLLFALAEEQKPLAGAMAEVAAKGGTDRLSAFSCPTGLYTERESCQIASDPRGFGLGLVVH